MPQQKTSHGYEIQKMQNVLTFKEFKAKKNMQFEDDLRRYLMNGEKQKDLLEFKDIGRDGYHYYLREDWEIFEQKNLNGNKAFVIEKLRMIKRSGKSHHSGGAKIGDVEYRIGYYIVTPKNRWWWGQSCPFVPAADMPKMIAILRRLSKKLA
ncbi:MAG: hypothetical protein PHX93_00140 [Candidatus Peribacteraceae bacterium]|jgi:hypothetical protein|nr:hypothetical protein [Candidatus Peribacteraceae bacterium]